MKVLFVLPDFLETAGGTPQQGSYAEGLASMSAVLKASGHDVELCHLTAPPSRAELVARLRARAPDLVGISVRTSVFPIVRDYPSWSKQAVAAPVILGGCHPTLCPEESLRVEGVDMVCVGEGEYALRAVCQHLARGLAVDGIPGIWTRNARGETVSNPVWPLIEDLDALPMPDLELFDFPALGASKMRTANVILGRGCPYSCSYCCNPALRALYPDPRRYVRVQSPDRAIAGLRALLTRYPFIRYLNFMDSVLPWRRAWFDAFAERYAAEIQLPFSCRSRPDLMDRAVVTRLARMGCYLVHLGVESGDARIRNEVLGRRLSEAQIVRAFDLCHEVGIGALAYNIVNAPTETRRTVLETVRLNRRLRARRMTPAICYPYPGTALHRAAIEQGLLRPDFDYADEVPISNPALPRGDVLFWQRFFRQVVYAYWLGEWLPRPLRAVAEAALDRLVTSPLVPRGLLARLGDLQARAVSGAKRVLQRRAPGAYLALRDVAIAGRRLSPIRRQAARPAT